MKKILFLLSLLSWTIYAISAKREPWETLSDKISSLPNPMPRDSVFDNKRSLKNLDIKSVPEIPGHFLLQRMFVKVRDTRFMKTSLPSERFIRRISWLFPDDGCFARAEMALTPLKDYTETWGLPLPKKIFIFGQLTAKTPNHPQGEVHWWYHVAPLYRVGKKLYVFDPAIDPQAPLKIEKWGELMQDKGVEYAICETHAFEPEDFCHHPVIKNALEVQKEYLKYEWLRQIELKRDPYKVLGHFPPWDLTSL